MGRRAIVGCFVVFFVLISVSGVFAESEQPDAVYNVDYLPWSERHYIEITAPPNTTYGVVTEEWLSAPPTITSGGVDENGTSVFKIPVVIMIPEDVENGDHYRRVFFSRVTDEGNVTAGSFEFQFVVDAEPLFNFTKSNKTYCNMEIGDISFSDIPRILAASKALLCKEEEAQEEAERTNFTMEWFNENIGELVNIFETADMSCCEEASEVRSDLRKCEREKRDLNRERVSRWWMWASIVLGAMLGVVLIVLYIFPFISEVLLYGQK